MKVKIFDDINIGALEHKINTFFEKNKIVLIGVKYSSCLENSSYVNYSAMVIYREIEEKKKPEMKPPMWK